RLRLRLADRFAAARPALARGYDAHLARAGKPALCCRKPRGPKTTLTALSIVVPCFNEQECLAALHDRLIKAAKAAVGGDYELVLVNDGSSDRTWEMMRDLV